MTLDEWLNSPDPPLETLEQFDEPLERGHATTRRRVVFTARSRD